MKIVVLIWINLDLCVCPQAKYVAQIIVTGVQIVGRAFVKALQSEVRASQQAAQARSNGRPNVRGAAADSYAGITLQVLLHFFAGVS